MTLPTFIHIGPGRTATTMFYEAFVEHPEICMSRIKETEYFSTQYFGGTVRYETFFDHCAGAKAVGEISNDYFYVPEAPERIAAMLPQVKLITVLRNPFERIRSVYVYFQRYGKISPQMSFDGALRAHGELVDLNLYSVCLRRFQARFSEERLLVSFYDDLLTDPQATMQDVLRFIGVDASYVPPSVFAQVNPSVSPRMPWLNNVAWRMAKGLRRLQLHGLLGVAKRSSLARRVLFKPSDQQPSQLELSPQARYWLSERFVPDIMEVEKATGRDLTGWYASYV